MDFSRARVVRLRSIYNRYLTANEDQTNVRQEPDGSSDRARWTVQCITDDLHEPRIYLRSCYERWLTATDEHDIFGKKVQQTVVEDGSPSIEWQPTYQARSNRGHSFFSLQSRVGGKLWACGLRFPANCAVTHFQHTPFGYKPHNDLWEVEVLEQHEEQRHKEPDRRTSSPPISAVDNAPPPLPREIIVPSPARQLDLHGTLAMNIFCRPQVVRLRSMHNKYLTADEDRINVRQEYSGSSSQARWTVQCITDDLHEPRIYLRSCYGCRLTATDEHDIYGKKVQQTVVEDGSPSIEWQPTYRPHSSRGHTVFSLQSRIGGYLWACCRGLPPYCAVTHFQHTPFPYNPHNVMWDVEILEQHVEQRHKEPDRRTSLPPTSAVDNAPPPPPREIIVPSPARQLDLLGALAMDIFCRPQVVRLRSMHNKYLTADEDRINVRQEYSGSSSEARWTVQCITDDLHEPRIYLRSCYGCRLTATDEHDIYGKKVQQTVVEDGSPSIEWQPTYRPHTSPDHTVFSLQSRIGGYLWACCRGFPPYCAVTHFQHAPFGYNPHNVMWYVEVLEQHEEQRHEEPDRRPATQVPNQTTSDPSSSGIASSGRAAPPSSSGRTPFFPGSPSSAQEAAVGGNVDSTNADTEDAGQLILLREPKNRKF